MYLALAQYDKALNEYQTALQIQEQLLPIDHPDIIRTMHNLAVIHIHLGSSPKAKEFLARAEETAVQMFSAEHPMMTLLGKTKEYLYSSHS